MEKDIVRTMRENVIKCHNNIARIHGINFNDSEVFTEYRYATSNQKEGRVTGKKFGYIDVFGEYHRGEESCRVVYEIKSSVSDIYSGCGVNFVGNLNYLVVPYKLRYIAYKYLASELRRTDIGVMTYSPSTDRFRFQSQATFNYFTFKLTDSEQYRLKEINKDTVGEYINLYNFVSDPGNFYLPSQTLFPSETGIGLS